MKSFLYRFFFSNSTKIAGWLPLAAVKISAAVVGAVVITGSGYYVVQVVSNNNNNNNNSSSSASSKLEFDDNAQNGLESKTHEEIQSGLDAKVAASKFAISINTNPVFPNASEEGNLNIINPSSNTFLTVVEIYTSDNRLVYKSGAIKPDQRIEKAKLSQSLDKGEYEATAYFLAYTPDTQEFVGKAGAKIKINILN